MCASSPPYNTAAAQSVPDSGKYGVVGKGGVNLLRGRDNFLSGRGKVDHEREKVFSLHPNLVSPIRWGAHTQKWYFACSIGKEYSESFPRRFLAGAKK